ncbi:MAG: hypothetical protein ACI843_000964 [Psychrobacter glaciei]|jgi:hypothetical protein
MNKIKRSLIYIVSVVIFIVLAVQLGTELITQYIIYTSGYTGIERNKLADDMGFSLLLMFGLIPEIILGSMAGWFIGKKLNTKLFGI